VEPVERERSDIITEPRRRGKADPLKKLRKAAIQTIREKGEQIAKKLLELTLEGDITCAKFLVALIENAPPTPQRIKKFRSLAAEWAAEPEWVDPLNDPDNPPSGPEVETYLANTAPELPESILPRWHTRPGA
jgi:hypothetical protein